MRKVAIVCKIAASALLPLAFAAGAHAQSIDYGSLEQLFGEPVTTSATGSPQRSTEVPVDMTIISADDIKRSGAHDLPTLLGRVAGVDVLNWSSQSSDVGIRGYDQPMSPRLLVLVNGRQVYLDHYGFTAWSTIPVQLSEIRQIEVVKGPNAALFGFNAVSGVVNIITYNPKYDNVGSGSVTVGSRNDKEVSLVQTMRLTPRLSARISAGAAKMDEWDNTSNFTSNQYWATPSRATFNLDTVASLTDKTELRFESSYSNTQASDRVSNYDAIFGKYITGSVKLNLTSDTSLGLVTATAYRNTLRVDNYLGGPITLRNTISVYQVQDLFKVGKHTFRLGVEYRNNEMPTTPLAGGQVSYRVVAPSAMWNWAISDTVSTALAVRSDNVSLKRTGTFPAGFPLASNANWDRDFSTFSYNAGLVWRLSDKDTVRLMGARGVQAPTLIELGSFQLVVPVTGGALAVMGNPTIAPSVVENTEVSYDHSFKAAKLGIRLFSQSSDNIKGQPDSTHLLQYPTLTTYPAIGWDNASNSKMNGFEISASGKLGSNAHWSGDYTGTDIKDTALAGHDVVASRVDFSRLSPKERANFNIGWAGGKWTLDAFVHQTGHFETFAPTTYAIVKIPAYTTLAANIGYDLGHQMTLAVSGQNLSGAHVQTAGFKVPSTVLVSLSKRW
ncbi:TonB-dependent receptor plug domain-containing protein [Asticcacaulis solisilvae]|uniref:TonB-dependent receptor plug domain-containing protein n=1 Tax=Asticcacaulis solisilvae TaxID=1217274 RepID=UPI003FD7C933